MLDNICLKFIFLVIASIFVIWQGVFFYKWHSMVFPSKRYIREMLLNTTGSLIGWLFAYYILFFRAEDVIRLNNFHFSDLIIFLIAFYGMNGELPNVLINKLNLNTR